VASFIKENKVLKKTLYESKGYKYQAVYEKISEQKLDEVKVAAEVETIWYSGLRALIKTLTLVLSQR